MLLYQSIYPWLIGFNSVPTVAFLGTAMYAVAALIERRLTGWATRGQDGAAYATGG